MIVFENQIYLWVVF